MYMMIGIMKRALRIIQEGLKINIANHILSVAVTVSAAGGHYVQLPERGSSQMSRAPFVGFV